MSAAHDPSRSPSRRRAISLAAACIAAALLAAAPGEAAGAAKKKRDPRPNVVVVMSDDQTADSMRFMPRTAEELAARGATFANSFTSFPLCCPSRATFLTGQYPHNHGVLGNELPEGGFQKLDSTNTLAVWLQRAGYYTGHIGKYLNHYEDVPQVIPPGWTEWYGSTRTYRFYGYQLNENGKLVNYGSNPADYQSDVFTAKAVDFIRRRAPKRRPFFLSVAYLAPHDGGPNVNPQPPADCASAPKPAPRHATAFDAEPLPLPPSFNEEDTSDKPAAIQALEPIGHAQFAAITREYRCRLESLLAVDDGVAALVRALRRKGELGNTVFVYTSDNGYFAGEHRIPSQKYRVYEPSIRVPLIIHGPGIQQGVTAHELAVNADLAPTILDITGVDPGRVIDGVSLVPAAEHPGQTSGRALLIETLAYSAVRTERYIYVEHVTGELELYDLESDPDQLLSLHADPAYDAVEASLAELLGRLRACAGPACQLTAP